MKIVHTEILVIGGGIAGCFAAIRASKMGKSVALLDKATLRRGGSVGPGMDHVSIGVHPESISYDEAREYAASAKKDLVDPNVTLAVDVHAYERVKDLEEFGVPLREDDGSYFIWRIPERHFCCISYRVVDTKVKLGKAVEKTTTKIFERTMCIELIKDGGRVIGAVGLNTRSGELTAFIAKATILCTGETTRQYIAPDGPFNTYFSPTNTGDAETMAYRAGAKMVNMEFLYWDYVTVRAGGAIVGVKPFDKMGKLINRNGEVLLNTPEESIMRCFIMQKEIIEGRSPLYWDLRDVPEDALKMYEREMSNEYPITKQWFKQRNLDIRKDLIPMKLDPCCVMGGPLVDERLRTSVPGLYAAGATTAFARAIVGASVTGDIAAEEASVYACLRYRAARSAGGVSAPP
ncbi:MAG: FAD-binding protein [Synergistaceae bacterium]|nr:FAD-binding protein [Synergistaceae bacterium]